MKFLNSLLVVSITLLPVLPLKAVFPPYAVLQDLSSQDKRESFRQMGCPQKAVLSLPQDTDVWVDAINGAQHSLQVIASRVTGDIVKALVAAKKTHDIKVEILLDRPTSAASARGGKNSNNINAETAFRNADIPYHFTAVQLLGQHVNALVVDESWALLGTGAIDSRRVFSQSKDRDFVVPITNQGIIKNLQELFEKQNLTKPHKQVFGGGVPLDPVYADLISSAKRSLKIYQQHITDPQLIQALLDKAKSTSVEIITNNPEACSKKDCNCHLLKNGQAKERPKFRLISAGEHYIHAKMILVDPGATVEDTVAKEGKILISTGPLTSPSLKGQKLELALLTKDAKLIHDVHNQFKEDRKKYEAS